MRRKWRQYLCLALALLLLMPSLPSSRVYATESEGQEEDLEGENKDKDDSTGGNSKEDDSSGDNSTGSDSSGGSTGGDSSGDSSTGGDSSGGGSTDQGSKEEGSSSKPKVDTGALEQERQEVLDKIDKVKDSINDIKSKIANLQKSKGDLQSYINMLDVESSALSEQIQDVENQIEEKQAAIETTQAELEVAEATADKQYEDMKIRIQYMYENGGYSYLESILTSKSFADMLNRLDYIFQMSQYDREMMDEYVETMESIESFKIQLEAEEEELELLSESLNEQKETVDLLIEEKAKEINRYQSLINAAASESADFEQQLKALQQAEAAIAAAAAAAASDADGDGGASGFMWPCPSSHRITSGFGSRTSPTPGASTYHQGIDIGASSGAAIVAAYSGRVTAADYNSSRGFYITISHGGGISTTYMHCSVLYVSVGQQVSKGQTIAAVGSTGISTAPHLHFGVIKNGSYVNPLNYVS